MNGIPTSRWLDALGFTPLEKGIVIAIVVLFFLAVGTGIMQPYYEAKAFERVTGKKVGYWDAVFLDLRVQEQTKESK